MSTIQCPGWPTDTQWLEFLRQTMDEDEISREQLLDDLFCWDSVCMELLVKEVHAHGGSLAFTTLYDVTTVQDLLNELEHCHA